MQVVSNRWITPYAASSGGPPLPATPTFMDRFQSFSAAWDVRTHRSSPDPGTAVRFQAYLNSLPADGELPDELTIPQDLEQFKQFVSAWNLANDKLNEPAHTKEVVGAIAGVATIAAWTSQSIGWGKSWVIDRGRLGVATALHGRELVAAHPGMARGARVRAYITGTNDVKGPLRVVRDFVIGPTNKTVPLSGGELRVPFTQLHIGDAWGKSFRLSSRIGLLGGVANAVSGTINLSAGIQEDGVGGIITTKEGRMGSLQLLGTAWGTSFNTVAAVGRRDPGQSARQAFVGASWLMDSKVKTMKYVVGTALGVVATVNLLGGLKALDS